MDNTDCKGNAKALLDKVSSGTRVATPSQAPAQTGMSVPLCALNFHKFSYKGVPRRFSTDRNVCATRAR
jgi:hypothetical protein